MECIVSDFVCNTCTQQTYRKMNALVHGAVGEAFMPVVRDARYLTNSSGSVSEFYIEPMLPCVGDIDIMGHHNDQLAIPAGHPVPRSLPAEFHREVIVHELDDTQFPCYVTISTFYKLVKCADDKHYYRLVKIEDRLATTLRVGAITPTTSVIRHGPAELRRNVSVVRPMSLDHVPCIRCLVWPPQAADWPTRLRMNGWPDTATIDCVVGNGCDVVQVAHPACREEEWTNRRQWRLSFSSAETVLLNSWLPKQQVVYHMLRVFKKTTGILANSNQFSNYFIKTLMFWACELYSQSTWNSLCVVSICTRLLHTIANWLKSGKYAVYFVTKCNLLDNISDVQLIEYISDCFNSVNDRTLCVWFIENYISRCAQQCEIVYDVSSLLALQNTVSAIVSRRQRHVDLTALAYFDESCQLTEAMLTKHVDNGKACTLYIEKLQTIDPRLVGFGVSVCFLTVASKLQHSRFDADLIDMLLTTSQLILDITDASDNHCPHTDSNFAGQSSACCELFDVVLIQLSRRMSPNYPHLIELSKSFLHSSLNCSKYICGDFHRQANCTLNTYLACLYCCTDECKLALNHCVMAVKSIYNSRSIYRIDRMLLPQFDANIDKVFGLIIFYKTVLQSAVIDQQPALIVDSLTAELFAYYLLVLCLSKEHVGVYCKVQYNFMKEYKERLHSSKTLFIADVLLYYVTQRQIISSDKVQLYSIVDRCDTITTSTRPVQFNTGRLTELLIQAAVEHLTKFRQAISRDYSSDVWPMVTTDYQAMYAYRCGWYQECFQTCNDNVKRLLHGTVVSATIPLTHSVLMDDELVSLLGLAYLGEVCTSIHLDRWADSVTQIAMSVYLLVRSQLQLRHCTASLTDSLRYVRHVHSRHRFSIINQSMMILVYRKTVLHMMHH